MWENNTSNKALLNLFVVSELPLKFVENKSIIDYTCFFLKATIL